MSKKGDIKMADNKYFKPINSPYMTPMMIGSTLYVAALNSVIVPADNISSPGSLDRKSVV